ncbi:6,7-dimethyl-8-ribityllumazine synthase [Marinicella meishanensis]|uniref:6,7-dimethyl-8-ribityllumazine synthase n=1 Tax=Marinicella meishanensis TaxID=2873263 RepID=UPI001CBF2278|nr:6,7-dimethyl-8-ribityllumazine synthase [Marinicella sp. NBU2979]
MKVAIITAPFYRHINDGLFQGAVNYLNQQNIEYERYDVPGALEVPLACQYLAQTNQYVAIVALGAVIRGETAHFDHVCEQSARGIMNVSLAHNIPIGNGIITVENEKQALARSSVDESLGKENKGKEAAQAAVALLRLRKEISDHVG